MRGLSALGCDPEPIQPERSYRAMQPARPPPTEDEPSGVPLPDPVTPVEEPPETPPSPKSPPKAPPDPIVA